METSILYDHISRKAIKVVSLNKGISTNDVLNMSGVVYIQIPDAPLKNGVMKMNIGHTLSPLRKRLESHLFDNFGAGANKTDMSMSNDTDDTMYIKVVKTGLIDREDALRLESLITANCAYDMTTLPNKGNCDILRLLKYNNYELRNKMYNKVIVQNHNGSPIIGAYDYDDIINGKYSIVDDIEYDLIRVGAIKAKIAV